MEYKLLLFDLDGTLLRSDKSISEHTLSVLQKCRKKGLMLGVATSRSEQNSMTFLSKLLPDILISSGGALVKHSGEYIYTLNAQYIDNSDHADALAYLDETKATLKIPQAAKRSGFINPANWKIQWIIIGLLAAVAIAAVVILAATRKKK